MLQGELSLAGFSPEDEKRLKELEAFRITPTKELPPVEFLFRFHDRPCFARGELTGLSGKAKSGKTFVCSILMALCFRNEVLSPHLSIFLVVYAMRPWPSILSAPFFLIRLQVSEKHYY